MSAKPCIVGMNNPYGTDPKHALYPAPERAAGYRLYAMLRDAYDTAHPNAPPVLRMDYIKGFDKYNVLSAVVWNAPEARRQGATLVREHLAGRRVVVLGRAAAAALGLNLPQQTGILPGPAPWFERRECRSAAMVADGVPAMTVWVIPHPSGMCREYNDPVVRARAGELLLALYEGRDV